MRTTAAVALAALLAASYAGAQTTSTSIVPATTSSTMPTSTSTTASSSSSSTVTPTTSTSVTTLCVDGGGQVDGYDPKECAQEAIDFGDTKESCRQDCCTSDFEDNIDSCDSCGCDAAALDTFKTGWMNANRFYDTCLVESGNGSTFSRFNLPSACQEYVGGCRSVARKHVRQCADADRCVTCCRTALRRWRQSLARNLLRNAPDKAECRKAVRCVRSASRKAEACRNACRRKPTCGSEQLQNCLAGRPAGREVLRCYAKCGSKCRQPDAYPACIQACQGLNQCEAFDNCSGIEPTVTTTTILGTTSTAQGATSTSTSSTTSISATSITSTSLALSLRAAGECLAREERPECVPVTTTSTSTSTSTSSTAVTTTSTSSTTSTTSPL